jgi:hypothetical protein
MIFHLNYSGMLGIDVSPFNWPVFRWAGASMSRMNVGEGGGRIAAVIPAFLNSFFPIDALRAQTCPILPRLHSIEITENGVEFLCLSGGKSKFYRIPGDTREKCIGVTFRGSPITVLISVLLESYHYR